MKQFLPLMMFFTTSVFAQTTTVDNLIVNNTATFSGPSSFKNSALSVTPPFGDNSTNISTTSFVVTHAACPSITDYGGDNSGVNDNVAAFFNTINAQQPGRACVFFPAGNYNLSGIINYTLPDAYSSLTVLGDGVSSTYLIWGNGGGLQITMPGGANNSVHIRDLSLLTGSAGTGNAAITLLNATSGAMPVPTVISDISNVSIRGSDGFGQRNYWNQGVYISSWSNINFMGLTVAGSAGGGDLPGYTGDGIGVLLTGNSGSGAAPQGVQYNLTGCQFEYLSMGLQYNHWVEGVTVNQSNFTGEKYGIYVATPNQGQDQLTVTGSQFNNSDYSIVDNIGIAGLTIANNYFLIPTPTSSGAGIFLLNVYTASISGNNFQRIGSSSNGTFGVAISKNGYAGAVITANTFTGLGGGVYLQSGSSNNSVQSNSYHANATNVINSGSDNLIGGGSP